MKTTTPAKSKSSLHWNFSAPLPKIRRLALAVFLAASFSLSTGVWQHVAVAVENAGGPASGCHLYINGVAASRLVATDMEVASLTTEPLRVGARKNRQDEIQGFFEGQIDELMFFNRALSAEEIAHMHAAGSAGVCPPEPPGSP